MTRDTSLWRNAMMPEDKADRAGWPEEDEIIEADETHAEQVWREYDERQRQAQEAGDRMLDEHLKQEIYEETARTLEEALDLLRRMWDHFDGLLLHEDLDRSAYQLSQTVCDFLQAHHPDWQPQGD